MTYFKRFYLFIQIVGLLLLVTAGMAWAQNMMRPAPEPSGKIIEKQSVTGGEFMAVTSHPLATKAAYNILEAGGSAADAAIAVQLVLGLVEPQSSGLGGGAFILYYDATQKKLITLDGREIAPLAATPDLFLKDDGTPMGFYDAVISGRSIGVPGTPALLAEMHRRFGVSLWADLFDDAIKLAEDGFHITPRLAHLIEKDRGRLDKSDVARSYFFNEGGAPKGEGTLLKNQNYAETLKKFRDQGIDYFYSPDSVLVKKIAKVVQGAGGLLSTGDFSSYQVKEREAVCGAYRAYKVCSMGEPSSGGLTVIQALGLLERFDLGAMKPDDPQAIHLIAEANRLAFKDRNYYMADPDFVETPGVLLTDPDYIKERSQAIDPAKRNPVPTHGVPPGWEAKDKIPDNAPGLPGTSHISIIDRTGNIVSMTTTIESAFGSRIMMDGFLLNNELTDFSFIPDKEGRPVANRVEGGKRPRSSMAPTIVFDPEGQSFLVIGSAGGSRIIGYVLQRLIAVIDWKLPIQEALDMPHFLARGDTIEFEKESPSRKALEHMGHHISVQDMNSGLTAVYIHNDKLIGAADPRREGIAAGR